MSYSITPESFDSLSSCWTEPGQDINWSSVFILPAWLKVWWQEFGSGTDPYLISVRQDEKIVGIAPLMVTEGKASIIGSTDVCDYLDFVVVPGMEQDFFNILLDDLKEKGISHLDMRALRPDSTAITHLVNVARNRGGEVISTEEDISVEMDLPETWDGYLEILSKKQRHELKRKLRRLQEAGNQDYRYYEVTRGDKGVINHFLRLFSLSREEKANFMTAGWNRISGRW